MMSGESFIIGLVAVAAVILFIWVLNPSLSTILIWVLVVITALALVIYAAREAIRASAKARSGMAPQFI